jgi:hypothetical protein
MKESHAFWCCPAPLTCDAKPCNIVAGLSLRGKIVCSGFAFYETFVLHAVQFAVCWMSHKANTSSLESTDSNYNLLVNCKSDRNEKRAVQHVEQQQYQDVHLPVSHPLAIDSVALVLSRFSLHESSLPCHTKAIQGHTSHHGSSPVACRIGDVMGYYNARVFVRVYCLYHVSSLVVLQNEQGMRDVHKVVDVLSFRQIFQCDCVFVRFYIRCSVASLQQVSSHVLLEPWL